MATSDRLQEARKRAGHTNASEFARLIKIAPNSVYRYERGDQTPSLEIARRWARQTGVTIDWLADGKFPPDWERDASTGKLDSGGLSPAEAHKGPGSGTEAA